MRRFMGCRGSGEAGGRGETTTVEPRGGVRIRDNRTRHGVPPRVPPVTGWRVVEPEELADALKRLAAWAEQHAPKPESAVRRRLREHLGGDPRDLPIVSRALAAWDRPNFQVAVDAWAAGREVEVVGLPVIEGYRAGLAELVPDVGVGPGARARRRRARDRAARRAREHRLRAVRPLARPRRRRPARGDAQEPGPAAWARRLGLEVMAADRERGRARPRRARRR